MKDLEQKILGSLLANPTQMFDVVEILTSNMFANIVNRKVYQQMLQLYDRGKDVDAFAINDALKTDADFKGADGINYLLKLAYPSSLTVIQGAALSLRENHVMRQIKDLVVSTNSSISNDAELETILSNLNKGLDEITSLLTLNKEGRTISAVVNDCLSNLSGRIENYRLGKLTGIPTGSTVLDKMTGGWGKGQLWILGGRPGRGKSAMQLQMAKSAAQFGKKTMVFSLEMTDVSMADRLILSECDVDSERYRGGYIDNAERHEAEEAALEVAKLPIIIDEEPNQTIRQIRAKCIKIKRKGGLNIVFIDYLQLIGAEDKKVIREQQVAAMTRSLKIMAKELSIPVILLCQLNREADSQTEPKLSNLRESGAIEQDADGVLFIYVPYKDGSDTIETNRGRINAEGVVILKMAKQRDGRVGRIFFSVNEGFNKFTDYKF